MKGKHLGNRNLYTDQRDRELSAAFIRAKKALLEQKGYVILREAVDAARCSPCSRYFVSEERAGLVINKLLLFDSYIESLKRGETVEIPEDPLENMIYMRRRMFSHLFMTYKRIRKENPDKPHKELVLMACSSPANEFYLTQASALEILSKIHINNNNNHGKTSNRNLIP